MVVIFTIWQNGGNFTVNSLDVISIARKDIYWGILGDSTTHGQYAGTYPNRWVDLYEQETKKEFTLMATGGLTLNDVNGNYSEVDFN